MPCPFRGLSLPGRDQGQLRAGVGRAALWEAGAEQARVHAWHKGAFLSKAQGDPCPGSSVASRTTATPTLALSVPWRGQFACAALGQS